MVIFSHNIIQSKTIKMQCNSVKNERWHQTRPVFHVFSFAIFVNHGTINYNYFIDAFCKWSFNTSIGQH